MKEDLDTISIVQLEEECLLCS